MTFLRLCKYIVLGLLGLIFLVVGGYLAINASDDTLSPDAQKLLAAPPTRLADADNAFFLHLGLNAPTNADAYEAGRKLQAVYDRLYAEDPLRLTFVSPDIPPGATASVQAPELAKLRCAKSGSRLVLALGRK